MRLIDEVVQEVLNSNLLNEVTHLYLDKKTFSELLTDYENEFEIELLEFDRKPTKEDLEDYLNIKVVIENTGGSKFKLLTKG